MNTILVPTDYSEVSANSVNYAAELAHISGAKIILFHAFHPPIVTTEVPVIIPGQEEMQKDAMLLLEEIQRKLKVKYNNTLKVECVCKYGLAVEEIETYANQNKVDLVVLGMQGSGLLTEKLIGSVTTALISKLTCPVLTIDKTVKFRKINNIVLANDFKGIKNKAILEPMKEFQRLFKSQLHVLKIVPEMKITPEVEEAITGIKLEHLLEDVKHDFSCIQNEDVISGINDYVHKKEMDMVIMIPRKHSFMHNIFNEPKSKQMAFHAHVPLLTIHE